MRAQTVELTWEQFEKLDEAAEVIARDDFLRIDSLPEAVEFLADRYLREEGGKSQIYLESGTEGPYWDA